MVLDIRADITCSLGTVINASINDDYVQGTGLITSQGNCLIDGIITPATGTIVTFTYTKGDVTRNVPRKMRVLSSFADPYRKTTEVQLGCKLTYLSSLKEPIKWQPKDDPQNDDITEEDEEIIVFPISAKSIANECLMALELTSSGMNLTNQFSIPSFDFSSGYTSILSDLLVSESKCGYLDFNENLIILNLTDEGSGSAQVLGDNKIIDIGSINSGEIPGDSVIVTYSTLKLEKAINVADPEAEEPAGLEDSPEGEIDPDTRSAIQYGEKMVQTNPPIFAAIVQDDRTDIVTHNGETTTIREFSAVRVENSEGQLSYEAQRVEYESTVTTSVNGIILAGYYQNIVDAAREAGISQIFTFDLTSDANSTIIKEYNYGAGDESRIETETKYIPTAQVAGEMNLKWAYAQGDPPVLDYVLLPSGTIASESTVTKYVDVAGVSHVYTYYYRLWHQTLAGQIATSTSDTEGKLTTAAAVAEYFNNIINAGLVFDYSQTSLTYSASLPEFASGAEKILAVSAKKPEDDQISDTSGGASKSGSYRTESSSEIEFVSGSMLAKRITEFSMPYAPDDRFKKKVSGEETKYYAIASDAPAKANAFGKAQNKLLLGNRYGMNITTVPEFLPEAPFSCFALNVNGMAALYRMNGTSWTMDSSGIVASTDGLLWGGIGTTSESPGPTWFPVAPGITILPPAPPTVDGSITVGTIVPMQNITVLITCTSRTKVAVKLFSYNLALLTSVLIPSHTELAVVAYIIENITTSDFALSALESVQTGSLAIKLSTTDVETAVISPVQAGDANTLYPPTVNGSLTAPVAEVPIPPERILFHLDGSNGSTGMNSVIPYETIGTIYGVAVLSNNIVKYGTASLYMPNTSTASGATFDLHRPFGTEDWCIEFWYYYGNSAVINATSPLSIDDGSMDAISVDIYHSEDTANMYIPSVYGMTNDSDNQFTLVPLTRNQWNHFTVFKLGANIYSASNGFIDPTFYKPIDPLVQEFDYQGTLVRLGDWIGDGAYQIKNDYIDEVKVTFSDSVYTVANFTPPANPFT